MSIHVPYNELDPDTLRLLVESFVTREGTDYGEQERSHDSKISQIIAQLKSGKAVITYDEESDSCNILVK